MVTEANIRVQLANDFLYKVDTANMKESLEVRVLMLDEELFSYGLKLPHRLKMRGHTGKQVLRAVASRRLPNAVAQKAKQGFAIPLNVWVDGNFKEKVRKTLLGGTAKIAEYVRHEAYQPIVQSLCDGAMGGQASLARLTIMMLSVELFLQSDRHPTKS